jgi:uncharacterized membrane protein
MKSVYRTIAGGIGLVSVAIQYWLVVVDGGAIVSGTVHFFSFFTILTNLLVAAALLQPVFAPSTRWGLFLDRPSVRTAIAGYIIVVGVVFYTLLRNTSHIEGWELFFDHVLHYVTPPLFVLDWLVFVPKSAIPWRTGAACLGYPAIYAAWTLGHGAVSGWYPYAFLDVAELGYPQALLNMAGLVVAFLVLELLLVAIGRLLARVRSGRWI